MPCDRLPSVNLDLWKERHTCTVNDVTISVGSAERISPCIMCTCTKEGVSSFHNFDLKYIIPSIMASSFPSLFANH